MIDLPKGIVALPTVHPASEIIMSMFGTARSAAWFRVPSPKCEVT